MRRMKRNRGLWMLGAAAAGIFVLAQVASATTTDVSTEQAGSIVVFPKVVYDGSQDTVIMLSNTSNSMAHAHCFYINAAGGQWTETDFDVWLTKQQPTHWTASEGRSFFTDGPDGVGFAPGLIPPVSTPFVGELKCVQVDPSGAPLRANSLEGSATIVNYEFGGASQYNAIAFQGNTDPSVSEGDLNDLYLDLTPTHAGEYSACPDTTLFNFLTDGSTDTVLAQIGACTGGGACPVTTSLTLVPCQEDIEHQVPGRVTVQFQVWDEFETAYSASTTVNCYLTTPLSAISSVFTTTVIQTPSAHARINPVAGNGGVIGIAEETRDNEVTPTQAGPYTTTAAYNLEIEGNRFDAATDGKGNPVAGTTDHIILPAN